MKSSCCGRAGITHPGLIGTAPSAELLKIWNDRERGLHDTDPESVTLASCLHTRPMGELPPSFPTPSTLPVPFSLCWGQVPFDVPQPYAQLL